MNANLKEFDLKKYIINKLAKFKFSNVRLIRNLLPLTSLCSPCVEIIMTLE